MNTAEGLRKRLNKSMDRSRSRRMHANLIFGWWTFGWGVFAFTFGLLHLFEHWIFLLLVAFGLIIAILAIFAIREALRRGGELDEQG